MPFIGGRYGSKPEQAAGGQFADGHVEATGGRSQIFVACSCICENADQGRRRTEDAASESDIARLRNAPRSHGHSYTEVAIHYTTPVR